MSHHSYCITGQYEYGTTNEMNRSRYSLDNRATISIENLSSSERPPVHRSCFCKGSVPIPPAQSYSTYSQQSFHLCFKTYSNDLYPRITVGKQIHRLNRINPLSGSHGFLVTVGVGVTRTNGSVSSDNGAMVATCGTVRVTGVVPPFWATLLATFAAAQTSFLT